MDLIPNWIVAFALCFIWALLIAVFTLGLYRALVRLVWSYKLSKKLKDVRPSKRDLAREQAEWNLKASEKQ